MKSESKILSRLKKLRITYAKIHISTSQDKLPHNCSYNYNFDQNLELSHKIPMEFERAPRINRTLVVFNDHKPIKICTYGSENSTTWNGDKICDNESVSKPCPWFRPKISLEEAANEFQNLVSDDSYVEKTYPDIAILQWVLDDRIHKYKLSWFERTKFRFYFWFFTNSWFFTKSKFSSTKTKQLPEDIWES